MGQKLYDSSDAEPEAKPSCDFWGPNQCRREAKRYVVSMISRELCDECKEILVKRGCDVRDY